MTSESIAASIEDLPGADLVSCGLADITLGRPTPEAALVEVARRRLGELGLPMTGSTIAGRDPELVLYDRLVERFGDDDPHGRYCAWLDQLVSFMSALETRRRSGRASAAR